MNFMSDLFGKAGLIFIGAVVLVFIVIIAG